MWLLPILMTAGIAFLFERLTRPLELRPRRWLRIGVSLPLVWLCATQIVAGINLTGGVALVLSAALLSFIWSGVIAHYAGGTLTNILYGRGSQSAGHTADYKFARERIAEEDFKEAIRLTQFELTKNPANYEGLMLLAALYLETGQAEKALAQVALILNSRLTTDDQKQEARAARRQCLDAIQRQRVANFPK